MTRNIVFCALLASISAFGQNWTGFLVDADCYSRQETNTRPSDQSVTRDRTFDIKQCAPTESTKSFTFLDRGGESFQLDTSGNAKAAEALRNAPHQKPQLISITGARDGNTLKVGSIAISK